MDDLALRVPARTRLLVDGRLLPIGAAKVAGTEYDFTEPPAASATPVLDTAFGDLIATATAARRSPSTAPDGARGARLGRRGVQLVAGLHRRHADRRAAPPVGRDRADDLPAGRVPVRPRPDRAGARRDLAAHLGHPARGLSVEFDEVVRRRRMVRSYDPDRPVPAEVVDRILEHAIRAPSAGFSQGWGFLVLAEPADRERFWTAATPPATVAGLVAGPACGAAPLIIVPLSNRSVYLDRYAEPDKGWTDRDEAPLAGAVLAHRHRLRRAADAAHRGRRGARRVLLRHPGGAVPAFREAFGVPAEYTPIGALTVGYRAADQRSPSLRRGAPWTRWSTGVELSGVTVVADDAPVALRSQVPTAASAGGTRVGRGACRRDLQSGTGRASVPGSSTLTLKQWAEIPPASDAAGPADHHEARTGAGQAPRRGLHVLRRPVPARGASGAAALYLEDGLHRALRAALQQRNQIHARVLVLTGQPSERSA